MIRSMGYAFNFSAVSLIGGVAMIASAPAQAVVTLDQEQIAVPSASKPIAVAVPVGDLSPSAGAPVASFVGLQTITPSLNGILDHIDLQVTHSFNPGALSLSLYAGNPLLGGALLTFSDFDSLALPDPIDAFDQTQLLTFDVRSANFSVVPGQTFAIGFEFTPVGAEGWASVIIGAGDPFGTNPGLDIDFNDYAGGEFFLLQIGNPNGQVLGGDIGFRSFVDTVAVSGPSVPEPQSWVMMVAGLGLLGGVLRMKRNVRIGASA